jgi:hypothetical protein
MGAQYSATRQSEASSSTAERGEYEPPGSASSRLRLRRARDGTTPPTSPDRGTIRERLRPCRVGSFATRTLPPLVVLRLRRDAEPDHAVGAGEPSLGYMRIQGELLKLGQRLRHHDRDPGAQRGARPRPAPRRSAPAGLSSCAPKRRACSAAVCAPRRRRRPRGRHVRRRAGSPPQVGPDRQVEVGDHFSSADAVEPRPASHPRGNRSAPHANDASDPRGRLRGSSAPRRRRSPIDHQPELPARTSFFYRTRQRRDIASSATLCAAQRTDLLVGLIHECERAA